MKRSHDASLKHLNSFSVEARASQLLELESGQDLQQFRDDLRFEPGNDLILGGGSNILFTRDVEGTVVLNRLSGKKIIEDTADRVLVEVCSGENWHQLVLWSLQQGLSGIENLSLIPGLAGAAPIQNIGAYGVELADVLDAVQAIEMTTGELHDFSNKDCQLAYRDSRFRSVDAGRYLITRIRLRLSRRFTPKLSYAGLVEELRVMGIDQPTAKQVSAAVIRIRQRKLPDPEIFGNAGSFFKNPVVSLATAELLANEFDGLSAYPVDEYRTRLSAAWMIEHCGWKGHREGDAGVSDKHALVLLNHGKASGNELLDLASKIRGSINNRFGIDLQAEPIIIK